MKPFGAAISMSRSCGVSVGMTSLLETGRAATLALALPRGAAAGAALADAFVESFESKIPLEWTELIELMIAERCCGALAL